MRRDIRESRLFAAMIVAVGVLLVVLGAASLMSGGGKELDGVAESLWRDEYIFLIAGVIVGLAGVAILLVGAKRRATRH